MTVPEAYRYLDAMKDSTTELVRIAIETILADRAAERNAKCYPTTPRSG